MARSIPVNEIRTGKAQIFKGKDTEDSSIVSSDGQVIASTASHTSGSSMYSDYDDVLDGIDVDESDTSVVRDDWLE